MVRYQTYQLILEDYHRGTEAVLEESKSYHRLLSRAGEINRAVRKKQYNAKVTASEKDRL